MYLKSLPPDRHLRLKQNRLEAVTLELFFLLLGRANKLKGLNIPPHLQGEGGGRLLIPPATASGNLQNSSFWPNFWHSAGSPGTSRLHPRGAQKSPDTMPLETGPPATPGGRPAVEQSPAGLPALLPPPQLDAAGECGGLCVAGRGGMAGRGGSGGSAACANAGGAGAAVAGPLRRPHRGGGAGRPAVADAGRLRGLPPPLHFPTVCLGVPWCVAPRGLW